MNTSLSELMREIANDPFIEKPTRYRARDLARKSDPALLTDEDLPPWARTPTPTKEED